MLTILALSGGASRPRRCSLRWVSVLDERAPDSRGGTSAGSAAAIGPLACRLRVAVAACSEALALPLAAPQRAFIEERRRDLIG